VQIDSFLSFRKRIIFVAHHQNRYCLTNFKSNDFEKTCIRNLLFKLQLAWAVARVLQRLRQTVIDRKRFD
jgi:hypothetical protein